MSVLQSEGFRVIGASWRQRDTIRNFGAFAESQEAHGMMATLWFYVPLRNWTVIEAIITESARAFPEHTEDE